MKQGINLNVMNSSSFLCQTKQAVYLKKKQGIYNFLIPQFQVDVDLVNC